MFFIYLVITIVAITSLRTLLNLVKINAIRRKINPTLNHLNMKNYVLQNEYLYRICFSFIIYLQNINSIVCFDSFTKFPFGLLVLCLIIMMMDKCSRALCERIQLQLFNRLSDDIEICQLLYYCRHLIILQVISTPRSNMQGRKRPFTMKNGDIRRSYTGSVHEHRIRSETVRNGYRIRRSLKNTE
jgi:hypothetical protein